MPVAPAMRPAARTIRAMRGVRSSVANSTHITTSVATVTASSVAL